MNDSMNKQRRFNPYRISHRQHIPRTRNTPQQRQEKARSFFRDLVLIAAGGCIGILGNQWFYESNKRLDARIEIQRDMIKDQLPVLNKIVNFSQDYESSHVISFRTAYRLQRTKDMRTGQIIRTDTLGIFNVDSQALWVPGFVVHMEERKSVLTDIEDIKANKGKIDPEIWQSFYQLTFYLYQHPLPKDSSIDNFRTSSWANENVAKHWDSLEHALFVATYTKLTHPFDD